jgi:hypothetical protein
MVLKTSTENGRDYQHRHTGGRYRHGCAARSVRAFGVDRPDLNVASRHGAVGGRGARIGLECVSEIEAGVGVADLGIARGCPAASEP